MERIACPSSDSVASSYFGHSAVNSLGGFEVQIICWMYHALKTEILCKYWFLSALKKKYSGLAPLHPENKRASLYTNHVLFPEVQPWIALGLRTTPSVYRALHSFFYNQLFVSE